MFNYVFADDAAVLGAFQQLNLLYKDILQLGPGYGYIQNPSKCKVVVRLQYVAQQQLTFSTPVGAGILKSVPVTAILVAILAQI